MDRVIALDYGDARIGVAITDPLGIMAQPLSAIKNSKNAIGEIAQLVSDYEVSTLVIGWPRNLKGEESAACQKVAKFQLLLEETLTIPIVRWDERLSTVAARKQLHAQGKSAKAQKSLIDSQAAAFLLEGYSNRKIT